MRLTVIAATLASVGLFTGAAVQAKDHGGLGETAQKALSKPWPARSAPKQIVHATGTVIPSRP